MDADFLRKAFPVLLLVEPSPQLLDELRFLSRWGALREAAFRPLSVITVSDSRAAQEALQDAGELSKAAP